MLLKGTLDHLAPEVLEQWLAAGRRAEPAPVDPGQADVWSAGLLLLEALTGRNPFKASLRFCLWHALRSLPVACAPAPHETIGAS